MISVLINDNFKSITCVLAALEKVSCIDFFLKIGVLFGPFFREEEIKEVNNIISTRSFNEEKLIDLQQTRNNSNEDLEGELEMENFLLTSMEKKNIPIKKSYHQNNLNIVYLLNKKKQIF